MEVEKRSSKGGFLQLFDWNVKSRKKLFPNKFDLPESSKQGNENVDDVAVSSFQQMKLHENMGSPSLRVSDYASSVSNDEGCGTKAPGVVARLMGLDSLPTLVTSKPGFTPFTDSHSFRHSHHLRIAAEFEKEHHFVDYGMRNKLDGFSRNPVEDRLQKLQNRPIERFQTEILPPRSAKSIPVTHHRLLSPIKSPGFILTRNAANIMEEASKIIEQSPHSSLGGRYPSFASSSAPLRIRDLKEKMEATQKASMFPDKPQRRPQEHRLVNSSKSQLRDKRRCGSQEHGVDGDLKNKNNSVSLATLAKINLQKGDGTTLKNNRCTVNKKEDDVKLAQLDKKQRNSNGRNRSTTSKTSPVLTQNNQKQNCAASKDRPSSKPKIPYQQNRRATPANGTCREIKTSKKPVENTAAGARKLHLVTSETGKELTSSKAKNFSGKRRPADQDTNFDGTFANNVVIKGKESSIKCNVTIDGSSNWDSVDRKNSMDVVSFTFTSPIKKSYPESEPSAQSAVRSCRSLCLKAQDDQPDLGTSNEPFLGMPVIDSDVLSILLEQTLKELSSRAETSLFDIVKVVSPSISVSGMPDVIPSFDAVNGVQKDRSVGQHDSVVSLFDPLSIKAEPKWRGVEGTKCNRSSENTVSGIQNHLQHRPTVPTPESSFSDSATSSTSNGSKKCLSTGFYDMSNSEGGIEIELRDSASSTVVGTTLEYIREVLSHVEDFASGHTRKLINVHLFEQLENQKTGSDKLFKPQRKVVFDCLWVCLEARRERAFSGSYEEWVKWSMVFERKELLVDEIYKEISGWTSMEELMADELVDLDMSSGHGKWLKFEAEALEEGGVIQNGILTLLIDEMVADFSFS